MSGGPTPEYFLFDLLYICYRPTLKLYGQLRSVTLENNDIDTDEMNALALSANKLTIIYDERIDYYQMVGSDTVGGASIELLFSKAFTPELIEENGSFRFKMTCFCQSLIRFSCYSSTLNCLLIKKAAEGCTEGYRDIQLPDRGSYENRYKTINFSTIFDSNLLIQTYWLKFFKSWSNYFL